MNLRRGWKVIVAVACVVALGSATVVWALVAETGAILETIALPSQQPESVAVDGRAGRAFVAGFDAGGGVVTVVDTHGGRIIRTLHMGGLIQSVAIAGRVDRAFVVSRGRQTINSLLPISSTVSMWEARTGRLLHTLAVGAEASTALVDDASGHVFVAIVGARKPDYSPVGLGSIAMLDARTGVLDRTVRVGWRPVALAVDTQTARVFVANGGSNDVSVLDTRSGRVVQTIPVGRGPQAIVVDEKTARVFVANAQEGTVSVLDARSGALVRTVPCGLGNDALAVDVRRGRVLVTSIHGVRVLDATTGVVLRTFILGGNPFALAVDGRTSRAFVTGTDGGLWATLHQISPGSPPEWAGVRRRPGYTDPHASPHGPRRSRSTGRGGGRAGRPCLCR